MTLDKLANGRKSLKIVACHFGNPWIQDVAELIYKHENVFADISGLVAGAGGTIYSEGYLDMLARKLSEAAYYAGGVAKFIFGTDYPVETHSAAMKLVQKMKIDSSDLDNLLHKNAERLFKI